jgi:hypothetical protein
MTGDTCQKTAGDKIMGRMEMGGALCCGWDGNRVKEAHGVGVEQTWSGTTWAGLGRTRRLSMFFRCLQMDPNTWVVGQEMAAMMRRRATDSNGSRSLEGGLHLTSDAGCWKRVGNVSQQRASGQSSNLPQYAYASGALGLCKFVIGRASVVLILNMSFPARVARRQPRRRA